jgi:branched-chain amino acid transport system substrate-binding protein
LLTGNWGPDLSLLIRAGMDSGLLIEYRTMLGHLAGTPTAIGPGGDGQVYSVVSFHENLAAEGNNPTARALVEAFQAKHDFDFIAGER